MAVVDAAVAEIPSPTEDLAERYAWLSEALGSTYAELGPRYTSWRTMITELFLRQREDLVVVTHFVAINAAIGTATGDDRVSCAPVGNGAVTVFDHDHKRLQLIEAGVGDAGPVNAGG